MAEVFTQARPPTRAVPSWALRTILAITGLIMAAFVLVHMLGNLKLLVDPASMDAYAAWLRAVLVPLLPREGLLWIARIVLAASLIAHVWAALSVKARAAVTRTRGARRKGASGVLAALMLPTGLLLLAFVTIHLLDLTIGALVAPEAFLPPDGAFHATHNVLASLARPLMSLFYALSLLALGAHLLHGIGLAIKDLGATGERAFARARIIGAVLAAAIVIGDGVIVVVSLVAGAMP